MLLESHSSGCGFQLYASSWDLRFLDMGRGLEVRTLFYCPPPRSRGNDNLVSTMKREAMNQATANTINDTSKKHSAVATAMAAIGRSTNIVAISTQIEKLRSHLAPAFFKALGVEKNI